MGVPSGTTPTLTLTFDSETLDLTAAENVYVTFSAKGETLTKTGADIAVSAQEIGVYLTQEETLGFSVGSVKIQVNWTYADGSRGASDVALFSFSEQLLRSVLT